MKFYVFISYLRSRHSFCKYTWTVYYLDEFSIDLDKRHLSACMNNIIDTTIGASRIGTADIPFFPLLEVQGLFDC